MKTTVSDLMTKDVVTVSPDATFKEMVSLLYQRRVSALPVVNASGRLVGIVSEADLLLKEELPELSVHHLVESRRRRKERSKAEAKVASAVMTSPAITVAADMGVGEAARLMHQNGIKRLPVVGPLGDVVGIVSRSDLLRVFLRDDAEIATEITNDVILHTMWMDPRELEVQVVDGVVLMRGELDRRSDGRILGGLVAAVDGVVSVNNQLTYRYVDERDTRPELAMR